MACGGPCGVSNFVESWIFLSICEKKPINGRIRGAKYVEFYRKVSKVGFFATCRRILQQLCRFWSGFVGLFQRDDDFIQLWIKSARCNASHMRKSWTFLYKCGKHPTFDEVRYAEHFLWSGEPRQREIHI